MYKLKQRGQTMLDNIRTKKYTMKEFRALERNTDGDLCHMYDHFLLLTDKQVDLLTSDDWSRYYDYKEELEYEMALCREEFGL
jgi:hypothetical protein